MSEQQATSTCPHPEAVGKRWGDPISEERQAELQGYLDRWAAETNHGERTGPFERQPNESYAVKLTGADVSWLAEESGRDIVGSVPNLRLEHASLSSAHLEHASLSSAHLEDAYLDGAHLEDANLGNAHLEGAFVRSAYLERAFLYSANLEGAILNSAHLEGANLSGAHLENASLLDAQLQGVNLVGAHLEGAILLDAQLQGAVLIIATFDKTSRLNDAVLTGASFDQATFDNTNLSVVDWKQAPILGDEVTAQTAKDVNGKRKTREERIADYQAAVRAYRRLAVALQANGLSTESANYLYRASIMERRLARHERRVGAYFFSVLLAVLAGYGYRLGRIVVAYITVVAAFALAFLAARYFSGTLIDWEQVGEATQISLNAIHGRVFFAQLTLDSVQAWIATVESVVGIVIEGVFVAMLIQRFFGR